MGIERLTAALEGASFSDAVVTSGPGRWINVAGQVALGEDGKVVEGDVGEQTSVTLDHIERILGRAGANLSHVAKLTVFLTSLDDYAKFSAARKERFGGSLPASSAVQVAGLLLGAAVEIEAVAFVPGD